MRKVNRINNILLFVLFLMIVGLGFNFIYSFNSFFYIKEKKVLGAVDYKENFILNDNQNISVRSTLISGESINLSADLQFVDDKRNDEFNLFSIINKENNVKTYAINCSFNEEYFRVNLLMDGKEFELNSNQQFLIKVNSKDKKDIILKVYRIAYNAPNKASINLHLINL